MNEINQLKKLMEAIDVAYKPVVEDDETLKEDWGSSDWYAVIKSMDKYIDEHGLSPNTIMDAARNAAEFWGDMMGYDMSTRDGEQDAIDNCKDGWVRMSEKGQQLQKMFGVRESIELNEGNHDQLFYSLINELDAKLKELRQLPSLDHGDLIGLFDLVSKYKRLAVRPDPRAIRD